MHTSKSIIAVIVVLTLVAAAASPNTLLVLAVGGVLAVGIRLLWPPTDLPVLVLPFALQWLQVAVKPAETALTGRPLDQLSDYGEALTAAAWLGLAAILALGLGMRLGSGRSRVDWSRTLARDASLWPAGLILPMAMTLLILGHGLALVAHASGPAVQVLGALSDVRFAGLFFLAYWCLLTGEALWLLAAVSLLEVLFGLTGFFADFREPVLTLLVAAAAARPRVNLRGLLAVGVAATLVLGVTIFWSAVKYDYRGFANEGTGAQVVTKPLNERLSYIGKAADDFDRNLFQTGVANLANRESYIDFLAVVLRRVPAYLPHEHGARLGQALLNIVTPRVLFPDKPPTPNDSEVTAYYTGMTLDLSGDSSISIGYLGELYIDFGAVGAVIGALVIGVLAGRFYAILRGYRGVPLFITFGIVTMAMLPFIFFDFDLVRFLGSAVTVFAGCLVLQRIVAPQVLLALAQRAPKLTA